MDKLIQTPVTRNFFFPPGSISISGLDITGCGYMIKTDRDSYVNGRKLDCHALLYYISGSGWFESENCAKTDILPGQAIVLFPDEKHWYGPAGGSHLEEYWFLYNGSLPAQFYRPGLTRKNPVLDVGVSEHLISLCGKAVDIGEKQEQMPHVPGTMAGLLFQILFEINTLAPRPAGTRRFDDRIIAVLDRIKKDPQNHFDFPRLAQEQGISYSLLRKRITELTGKSPVRFLNAQRISLASRLLAHGLTIKEVCYKIGMADPYYFSRLYKRNTGKSPRGFYTAIMAWDSTRSVRRRRQKSKK